MEKIYRFQEEIAQRVAKGEQVRIPTGSGKRVILKRALEILEQDKFGGLSKEHFHSLNYSVQNIPKPNLNWIPCGEKAFSAYDSATGTLYYDKVSSLEEVISKKIADKFKNAQSELEDFIGRPLTKKEEQQMPDHMNMGQAVSSSPKEKELNREDFNPYRVLLTNTQVGQADITEDEFLKVVVGYKTHSAIMARKLNSAADEHANTSFELAHARREISKMNEDARKQDDTIKRQADLIGEERQKLSMYSDSMAKALMMIKSYKKQVAYWKSRAKKLSTGK